MTRKRGCGSLLAAVVLSLGVEASFAQVQNITTVLTAIRNDAAKVSSTAGAERETAKQALLREVGNAIAKAKNSEEVSAILTAALTAAPSEAVAITRVAVAAAPTRAVEITTIAMNSVKEQGQRVAIVNTAIAAFNASRRDATTTATLQSLLTQNQGTQTSQTTSTQTGNNDAQQQGNKANNSDSQGQPEKSDSLPPPHVDPLPPPAPRPNASPS